MATAKSPSFLPNRCIATDQSGKHRVIVSPPSKREGPGSGRPPQLRFVIMPAAELEVSSQARSPRRKKRPAKGDSRRRSSLSVSFRPVSEGGYPLMSSSDAFLSRTTPSLAMALDYFLHTVLPHPRTGDLQDQITRVYLPIVRMAMQHEDLFEALMACALAFQEIRRGRLGITPAIAYHSSRSITCLRGKLDGLAMACPDDAAILTVMLLTDGATKYGTRAEVLAHYSGLRKMVNMRGGLEGLGDNAPLKAMLEYAELVAEMLAIPRENEKLAEMDSNDRWTDSRVQELHLDYPTHPFPPDLCQDISNLPEGFRELALSLRLSREVIRLIIAASRQAFFEAQDSDQSRPQICCPSMVLMYSRKYLGQSSRVTERIVCLSVLISCMRSVSFAFGAEELPLLEKLASLAARRSFDESSTDQDHHYAWTVIMAAEACRRGTLSSMGDQLVCDLLGPTVRNDTKEPCFLADWTRLEGILKRYLWTKDLVGEWRRVWVTVLSKLRERERIVNP